jgi:putative spermidine/putrescine transport system permease protein
VKPGVTVRVVTLVMAAVFFFPTIIVAGTSFNKSSFVVFPPKGWSLSWYETVFKDGQWTPAIIASLEVGVLAAAIAMLVGTLLGFAAARARLLPQPVVTALAMLPVIVPSVVAGLGFYIVSTDIHFTGNVIALGLAHATLGVPFVFINVIAALTAVDPSVEEASRVCGASELVTLVRVTLPLIAPAALVGGVLAFIGSWDEVIVAGFMTSPTFRTVPIVMYGNVLDGASPDTSAVATMVTLVSLLLLGAIAAVPALRGRRTRRRTA